MSAAEQAAPFVTFALLCASASPVGSAKVGVAAGLSGLTSSGVQIVWSCVELVDEFQKLRPRAVARST